MKFNIYLESKLKKFVDDAHVPGDIITKIKAAKSDDDAVEIALAYFKDPDDAWAFIDKTRSSKKPQPIQKMQKEKRDTAEQQEF